MSDQTQWAHRGNDDDMPAEGDRTEHGKPQVARARDPQPAAREGKAGRRGAAERPVVPTKPGNAGRGKGPWFKVNVRRGRQPGDWREPNTSIQGWEAPGGVAHQSEERAQLSVVRLVRQAVPDGRLGIRLPALPGERRRPESGPPSMPRHQGVRRGPLVGRIGGRTPKGNVSAPTSPTRVHS